MPRKSVAKKVLSQVGSILPPESITLPYNFIPRPHQLQFFKAMDNGCKRYFKRWSRRAGKDICDFNFMIKKAFERVGNYYYVFPSYTQGKKAVWEGKTKHQYRYLDYIPEGLATFNGNEMRIELANKSTIRIVGSDNIDALRGAGPCGVVLSEFAWQSMEVIEVIEPMLQENGGWLVINSTPDGKNFMYEFEQQIKTHEEWVVHELQSLWDDLPNYYPCITSIELDDQYLSGQIDYDEYIALGTVENREGLQKLRNAGYTEEKIEQEYGVSYVAGSKGNYYADQIIAARNSGRIGSYPYNDHRYVDVFFDLGWSDDTTMGFKQIDGDRHIWINYHENNTKDLKYYVQFMKETGYKFRDIFVPHDAKQGKFQSGFSHAEILQGLLYQAGIDGTVQIAPKPNSKQEAINAVRSVFSTYFFNETLVNDMITKVSLYHRKYDKDKGCFGEQPVHDWTSHAADMLTTDALTRDQQGVLLNPRETLNLTPDWNPLD